MYPAPFRYHRPASIKDAIALLTALGESAKPLAGGQSLIPILKLRMDEPSDLVDIGRLPGLAQITQEKGEVRIGTLATHARIAASAVAKAIPIVRDCAAGVADAQVRSRGTIGGSVCTADPSGDWPALLHVLDARVVCLGSQGERTMHIKNFIQDAYTTALYAGELVTQIRFKVPPAGSGGAYIAFKKAAPAYPAASAGVQLVLEGDVCREARLVLGAAATRPVTSEEAEDLLRGRALKPSILQRAADAIVAAADPPSDARGSSAFKRKVLRSLFLKTADTAARRGRGTQTEGGPTYV